MTTKNYLKIPVDNAVNEVVQKIGGRLVEDLLPSSGNRALNADFVFESENVIGELKRLVKDVSEDPGYRQALRRLFDDFERDGLWKLPPRGGVFRVQSRDLPKECAQRWTNLLKPKVEQQIRKANRQIRRTKQTLNMPDSKGLLIVAHDGNYGLAPEAAMNLISRCLRGTQHSHIEHVVYFTVNMPATSQILRKNTRVYVSAPRYPERNFPKDLPDRFLKSWIRYEEDFYGEPIEIFEGSKVEDLDHVTFDDGKPHRPL